MRFVVFKFLSASLLGGCALGSVIAQSSDQNFPTPITSNEISATVKARDMGDARLTTYFYAFNGEQGDIFLSVLTKNFSGDIDIFNADGMQLLTKMVIYADSSVTETGRLIYLRKPEKLLLRIEGRSPNDDAATFRIKFGGSFVALAARKNDDAPRVGSTTRDSSVRVNSVGTILESPHTRVVTKTVTEPIADATPPKEKKAESEATTETPVEQPPTKAEETKTEEPKTDTVFENTAAKVTVEPAPKAAAKRPTRTTSRTAKNTKAASQKADPEPVEKKPDPLASIRLVVELKDGTVIERAMSEVLRFNVVNGVLTVTGKDGKIEKYSILDVAKVTIE